MEKELFWKWWVEKREERKKLVKDMVNEGRIELIGGEWRMNEEDEVK